MLGDLAAEPPESSAMPTASHRSMTISARLKAWAVSTSHAFTSSSWTGLSRDSAHTSSRSTTTSGAPPALSECSARTRMRHSLPTHQRRLTRTSTVQHHGDRSSTLDVVAAQAYRRARSPERVTEGGFARSRPRKLPRGFALSGSSGSARCHAACCGRKRRRRALEHHELLGAMSAA
jgi:hypothetical protein